MDETARSFSSEEHTVQRQDETTASEAQVKPSQSGAHREVPGRQFPKMHGRSFSFTRRALTLVDYLWQQRRLLFVAGAIANAATVTQLPARNSVLIRLASYLIAAC